MGDLKGLAKSKMMELEELYLGIPDDSVNLTFQDLANVKQNSNSSPEKKKSTPNMETIQEGKSSLNKLPSLDFNRGLQESKNHHHHSNYHLHDHLDHGNHHHLPHHQKNHHHHRHDSHHDVKGMHMSHGGHGYGFGDHHHGHGEFRHEMENSRAYDDMNVVSMNSIYQERGGRPRRPGIPHSNICTICSTYIYIFRHRCLVCGRVYCRNCVSIGMGEMTEGRKCIECLGRRFSQRYIQRAGNVGCCSRYTSNVKQAELRWAEKGPRRTGERAYGHSTMVSRSRSPVNPRTPSRTHVNNSPPSFVSSSSPYSPYSPNHLHLPL